jgi:diguanylate cyclase (GGDEF)-like protein
MEAFPKMMARLYSSVMTPSSRARLRSLLHSARATISDVCVRYPAVHSLLVFLASALGIYICNKALFPLLFYSYWIAICWPVDGIMIAVLLMRPRREWFWILCGSAVAQLPSEIAGGQPWVSMTMEALCNIFEIVFAAASLPAFRGLSAWLRQPRLVVRFTVLALTGAPLIAGVVFSTFAYLRFGTNFWWSAGGWLTSDMLGIALFVPLVLALCSREIYGLFGPNQRTQTLLMFIALAAVSWIVFHQNVYPIAFLSFAVLVVIVNRMGFSGAVLAVNLLTAIAASATIKGTGPFMFVQVVQHPTHRAMTLQVYLTVAMVMCFSIALTRLERDDFQEQLKLALGQMELLANRDGLTGLGNRRLFDLTLEAEWKRARRERRSLGLILLDADKFKVYNDRYGHIAGDGCLRAIADSIALKVRRAGDLAARYGGEEFVVLLAGATLDQTHEVAESIRQAVEALQMEHGGNSGGYVTVSLGCNALVPDDALMPEQLVADADEALYAAKQSGRNQVVCASGRLMSILDL